MILNKIRTKLELTIKEIGEIVGYPGPISAVFLRNILGIIRVNIEIVKIKEKNKRRLKI